MVGVTESAPRESGLPRRAGLRCMLMSVERSCVQVVDSLDDPVTGTHDSMLDHDIQHLMYQHHPNLCVLNNLFYQHIP
jgi:hypothetical protein